MLILQDIVKYCLLFENKVKKKFVYLQLKFKIYKVYGKHN